MTFHKIKSWPEWFEPLASGEKTFELRRNDRDYRAGDYLVLLEWEPNTGQYTGRELERRVTYVLHGPGSIGTIKPLHGLSRGFVILGLEKA